MTTPDAPCHHVLAICHHVALLSVGVAALSILPGCATGPEIAGYPVNTPKYHSENKVFVVQPIEVEERYTRLEASFQHLYQVDANTREQDVIHNQDPVSVILQGVRLPEDLSGGRHDIAVVLDVLTSGERGMTSLVAFYQRDVPAGQMLNFNNLLVYADPMWDSANPPYFRVRVLDVKAERNRSTGALLSKLSNISAQIGGMVPHPVIPVVTSAIDAANLLLSNRRNLVLLDYQVQFYGLPQVEAAGGATLGPLLAGQWAVLGKGREAGADFWNQEFLLERKTDRVVVRSSEGLTNVPVPYVSLILMKADAQVPKLVMDRSESLLSLLSTPSGKSDVDQMEQFAANLMSSVKGYIAERRLRKYRSKADLEEVINGLDTLAKDQLRVGEYRRLMYVLDTITGRRLACTNASCWLEWWEENKEAGSLVEDATNPLGFRWQPDDHLE